MVKDIEKHGGSCEALKREVKSLEDTYRYHYEGGNRPSHLPSSSNNKKEGAVILDSSGDFVDCCGNTCLFLVEEKVKEKPLVIMKDEKIKTCNYCQKGIIEGISDTNLCIVERQRPSTADYPENLNRETKDIFYHCECYRKKFDTTETKKLREKIRETMTIHHYAPKGIFKNKNEK
ncbi:17007_t:CDS:2 [Funneliformis geosporum]|nr:17007_t:CDS:2 [Funneliformis geosporum]